jgi:hypothetical protein
LGVLPWGGINDSALRNEKKELELADTIVVASDFVRRRYLCGQRLSIQSPFGTPFLINLDW